MNLSDWAEEGREGIGNLLIQPIEFLRYFCKQSLSPIRIKTKPIVMQIIDNQLKGMLQKY